MTLITLRAMKLDHGTPVRMVTCGDSVVYEILVQVWLTVSPLGPLTHLVVILPGPEYTIATGTLGVGLAPTLGPWPLG